MVDVEPIRPGHIVIQENSPDSLPLQAFTMRSGLLDSLQAQLIPNVVPALDRALGRVDDYLFDRSQSGDDSLGLTALRDLRQVRAQILKRFEQSLLVGFRSMRQAQPEATHVLPRALGLLSEEGLEEQLATEQLAQSLTRLHAPSLEVLGLRMARLLGQEELPPSANPFAPAFLATALVNAMEGMPLDAAIRIVVFKFLERELSAVLATSYERSNALLVNAGVLPNLRPTAQVEPAPQSTSSVRADAAAGSGAVASQGSPRVAQWSEEISPADQTLFSGLLGLLRGWRAVAAPADANPDLLAGPAQTLSSRELLAILNLLQRDSQGRLLKPAASTADMPLAQQLRQEVVRGARKMGVPGDNLQLDGLDEDAVDLVALLFDVLLEGPQFDNKVRHKMGRMLVPYVKVAVADRRMFLSRQHPARRLLNAVAEACEGNHGEAPQERQLLERVDDVIDRLVAEFNEDLAIFEMLEHELRGYMAQHRKRAELAEKRAAESQHGREKLEHARLQVKADLEPRRGTRKLPRVIDEFLSRHAAHHLTQVVLRDGRAALAYEEALAAVDAILLSFDYAELGANPTDLPALPRTQLEAILASSGCVGAAAQGALKLVEEAIVRLSKGEAAADNPSRMPDQVLAPEPPAKAADAPELRLVRGTERLDFEAPVLARMRELKVGSWLNLATAKGQLEPAKVSWVSPISGRLLLVNRRGIRVLVASVEELAAMEKLGKLQLREGDTAFEGAMHEVAERLRSVVGT